MRELFFSNNGLSLKERDFLYWPFQQQAIAYQIASEHREMFDDNGSIKPHFAGFLYGLTGQEIPYDMRPYACYIKKGGDGQFKKVPHPNIEIATGYSQGFRLGREAKNLPLTSAEEEMGKNERLNQLIDSILSKA